jgi:hypothetical protein
MTDKETRSTEFIELPDNLKLSLLRRDGVYVGKLKKDDQPVILFQLYSFYVEIYYEKYRTVISKILVSDNISTLQPYLSQINVKDINKGNEKK